MKKLVALVVVMAGLALPAATNAAATTDTISFEAIITDCNLNRIQLDGSLLIISTTTLMPSGGFAFSIHSQPLNVRGVGLDTGASYIGTGLTRDTSIALPAGGSVLTFVNEFHIQATAGADSFIVSQLLHVTVTGDGTVRAFVNDFYVSC